MDKSARIRQLFLVRDGLLVRRFHTVKHVNMPETVGHHTSGIIGLLFYLYNDNPPIHMIRAALHHDIPEAITGDIPATAKVMLPALDKIVKEVEAVVAKDYGLAVLTGQEADLLRFVDVLDLCFKSMDEISSGNTVFQHILANGMGYCIDLINGSLSTHKPAIEMFQDFLNIAHMHIEEIKDERNPTIQ